MINNALLQRKNAEVMRQYHQYYLQLPEDASTSPVNGGK